MSQIHASELSFQLLLLHADQLTGQALTTKALEHMNEWMNDRWYFNMKTYECEWTIGSILICKMYNI